MSACARVQLITSMTKFPTIRAMVINCQSFLSCDRTYSNILSTDQRRGYRYAVLKLSYYSPLSDIPMLYANYITMHKVHIHTGAIRQLLYGCAYVREIIHYFQNPEL